MPIKVETDQGNQLTIFTVTGKPTFQEGASVYQKFYRENPTLNVLWDLRKGSLDHLTNDDFQNIVYGVRPFAEQRKGGKTALLVSYELEDSLLEMIKKSIELSDIHVQIAIFTSMEEATQWLGEE